MTKKMGNYFPVICWLIVVGFVIAMADSKTDLTKINNILAFDMYKRIADMKNGSNVFFSPFSISASLAMVYLGARGNTKAQMKTALHLGGMDSDLAIKEAYKQLLTTFQNKKYGYFFHLANRLYGNNDIKFQPSFLQETQDYFSASSENLDFTHKPERSRVKINSWVAKKTNDAIRGLVPYDRINSQTVFVIVNAIYFIGSWKYQFFNNYTDASFHISKTEQIQMDMMTHYNEDDSIPTPCKYHDSKKLDSRVIELPLRSGKASMLIFLPREIDGLSKLEEKLTAEKLDEEMVKMRRTNVRLTFPMFDMKQTLSLRRLLQSMGMTDLYSSPDLSGMGTGEITVSDAIHKSYVVVDKYGVKLVDETVNKISSFKYFQHPVDVTVDRPFLYMIIEKNTNTILFLGRFVGPPIKRDKCIETADYILCWPYDDIDK